LTFESSRRFTVDGVGTYRISQLADRCGVPATTLRFYETAGLLPAGRTASGYRVYDQSAVERMEVIASAKHLGLSLDEIRDLLNAHDHDSCASVRTRLLALVQNQIDQAGRRIAELTAFSHYLAGVHQDLSGPAPAGCCGPGCGCVTPAPAGPVDVELGLPGHDAEQVGASA
jgi:DNA-binding transcriptional MerR regulator